MLNWHIYELKAVLLLGSKFVRTFGCLRIKVEHIAYLQGRLLL